MGSNGELEEIDVSKLDPKWHDFMRAALVEWKATAFSVRRRLGGRSGATVLLVDLITPKHDGQGVLKLSDDEPLGDEHTHLEEALRLAPALTAHVPQVTHHHDSGPMSTILLTVAGGGLLEAEVMAKAEGPVMNSASQRVSESLLTQWNKEPIFHSTTLSANVVLNEWLDHRLSARGRIPDVLREVLNIPDDTAAFRYGGVDYPNPYGFSNPEFAGNQVVLSVGRGLVHGDLHSENILVSGARSVENYFFIDFATFKSNAPLLFDHSYLELHLLLNARGGVTHQHWQELCAGLRAIERPQDASKTPNSDDHGLLWTIGMLRQEVRKWVDEKYPQRLEDLKKQILLARIASGLNFANKRALATNEGLSRKRKFFAILYAAEATRALFEYCKLEIPNDGPIAHPEGEVEVPASDRWRDVWETCNEFQSINGVYILIAGKELGDLPEHARKILGRLPWSLVIDFDTAGTAGRLVQDALPVISRARAVTQIFPHQSVAIDFESSACWFFADSNQDMPDTNPLPVAKWRQKTLPPLRTIASALHRATVPTPTYLVIMATEVDNAKLRNTFTAIDEAMAGTLYTVMVSTNGTDEAFVSLQQETTEITNVTCDWTDLSLGLHQMLGDEPEAHSLWLPVRDSESMVVRRERLEPEEAARYSGAIEVVPASGSDYGIEVPSEEVADFYRGNTISWQELNLHRDVDRTVTGGPNGILQIVRRLLYSTPSDSFAIEHSPGAGGTTVARRVAWELRDEFPCLILNALTASTIDDIEALFQRSNLPVLIVAEAAKVPGTKRNSLYNDLKGRSIRFVILDVRRRHQPRNTTSAAALADPMSVDDDARRFLAIYEPRAPQDRRPMLDRLAKDPSLAPYRSAFFFGLYTFEREFVGVEDYVASLLSELAADARYRLAQLALISRYSQARLPIAAFVTLLGLDVRARQASYSNLLGDASTRLVMFDGKRIGISHPLLAEEIIRKQLSPEDAELENAWKINLTEFCINFVEDMAQNDLRDSADIDEILVDLFIERDFWRGSSDIQLFSALIMDLPAIESQKRVLEALCEHFPNNPHYWNHLGRHINFHGTGTFEEAEEKLKRAIELDPGNDLHHHALGMVYRIEVRRRLQKRLSGDETVRQRLDSIKNLFAEAEICFKAARGFDPINQYPLITPIQMVLESFERLSNLSGETNYQSFFCKSSYVSEWCRDKISTAEILVARLHHIEANSARSEYSISCDARLDEVLGNFEGMVNGLTALLAKPDIKKSPVRRMLANAYVRQIDRSGQVIKERSLRRVVSLMRENLTEDPSRGYDIRTWFRAFRMLPDFTLTEAIEQMTRWSLVSDSVDAHYYLYVLHFVQSHRGVHESVDEAKRHLEITRQRAPTLLSKKSFEWWGGEEQGRPCPLIHHTEMGQWSKQLDFFEGVEKLDVVEGRIDRIRSPQSGTIMIDGLPAFFVPRADFRPARDLNATVRFNLGFSYEGLRAWRVRRA